MFVTVVGVGADGWAGLAAPSREAIRSAEVLLGSARQLDLIPPTVGRREPWPSPLLPSLPGVLRAHARHSICVLASGDPMFYGIGATLARLVGPDQLRILPHPSSFSLACARLAWPAEGVEVISLVGRPIAALNSAIQPGRRLLILSADGRSPATVAQHLTERGYGESTLTVLEQLDGPTEQSLTGIAATWEHAEVDALNVVAVQCRTGPDADLLPSVPGLPDDAYDHDGQLTKREIRAITLARLAPVPGQLLWDVGAGAGSIAIEWLRTHRSCRAIAIEQRAERLARITANAARLGVPGLGAVAGNAPTALTGLPRPDAIFIGGGVTAPGMVEVCWGALAPGGRLVANAVTIESERVLTEAQARLGGDLTRIEIQHAAPVGGFTAWRAMHPVTQWSVVRPPEDGPTQGGSTQDRPAQDSAAQDSAAQDGPAQDRPSQDGPGQDGPGQGHLGQDGPPGPVPA